MNCLIICNGEIKEYSFYSNYINEADYIICADGGAVYAKRMGVTPNLLLGDFDSIDDESLDYYKKSGVEIRQFEREKDKTDTEIAVDIAIEKKFANIIIIGAIGSRIDHTLSNIFLLKKILTSGALGKIVNENNEIYMVSAKNTVNKITIQEQEGHQSNLSILSLTSESKGISTTGLYYPIQCDTLHFGSSRGVSNKFLKADATIQLEEGVLLIMRSVDKRSGKYVKY